VDIFYMPTRIVSGIDALASLASTAKTLGMRSILLVSDPIISQQTYYGRAVEQLSTAGIKVARFEECEIDARVRQIDAQGQRARQTDIDGIISIGGGSVMCAGKGIAIVATNGKSMRECTGVGNFENRALPMIMVPTTAGSGSEVSQWTIVKDEENHSKLVGGGPLSFPDVAILDPAVLDSLPTRIAAGTGVDALTHAVEAYMSGSASPITDAVALEAIRLQAGCLRASVCGVNDIRARAANIMASTMANIACGNARLGHGHTLSLPLESLVDLPHVLGVGVLLPHVLAFNLMILPEKALRVAEALGVRVQGAQSTKAVIGACVSALRDLYNDIGFPQRLTHEQLPSSRIREMAERAVPGLYAGADGIERMKDMTIGDDTVIESLAPRKMTVRQAEAILAACVAPA
jgi:alcohol dehydrogenase class IV